MKHRFANPDLLTVALTHTSHAFERGGDHNERLEFLGDAVLQLCATELLYSRFPADREGVLHGYRVQVVSTEHLAGLARQWGLDQSVLLGKGEERTGGRNKDRLLAGVFEAVLGAIYLDGGYDAVRAEISSLLDEDLSRLPAVADPRKTLHEWSQRQHGSPPVYEVVSEEGPPHERVFRITARCGTENIAEGEGASKKAATIAAARQALTVLGLA